MSHSPQDFEGLTPEEKRAKLRQLLGKQVSRPRLAPVSFAQERLWILDQLAPGNITYSETGAVRLEASLDPKLLEELLNEVVRRHEVLRTTFTADNGTAVQRIAPSLRIPVAVVDLTHLPPAEREAEARRQAAAQSRTAFDLSKGPLLRVLLLEMGPKDQFLVFTLHHIVADGWSISVLIRELMALFLARLEGRVEKLPALPIQYADFARWQRDSLRGEVLENQLAFWKKQLAGLPVIDLPTDHPRPPVQTFAGTIHQLAFGERLTSGLRELSRREGVTLFMTVLAAFKTLMLRYAGSRDTDMVVGSPVAGRNRREVEGLIGFFVNMLPLRTDMSSNPTFRELLRRVQKTCLDSYAHEEIPFEKVIDELDFERDASRNPLFQVVFALFRNVVEMQSGSGMKMRQVEVNNGTSKYDLTLFLWEGKKDLVGQLEYNTDLFDARTIERMADHLKNLLEGIVADPAQRLSDLPLVGDAERNRLLNEWNPRVPAFAQDACLHRTFETQVERTPDAVAVVFEGTELTYAELDLRANQLARHLRSLGVGPEERVAMYLEPSLEMVVGILGILKAGAAYVPINPEYPLERVRYILEDTAAPVLLTGRHLRGDLPDSGARVVCLDTDWETIARQGQTAPGAACTSDNLAYIIYTSGSTGKPKGVQVTHANVARLFEATRDWFHFGPKDVWTLFHSYAFDFSVWELWGPLLFGGRLVVVPHAVSRSPQEFFELVRREGVTVLNQTPSAFRQFMHVDELATGGIPLALRFVIFGGEALELQSLGSWFDRHTEDQPRLVNMYGITETTVHVTYRPIRKADVINSVGSAIGKQIPDLQLYILDPEFQPVPTGVPGEIHVGGDGLARGYLNRGDLTADRFVPNPFGVAGSRLYRTGDVARYRPDGSLEYLGRADHQVKIRGFRIELGEIESVIQEHPGIRQAVVLAREDTPGVKRLAGYIVPRGDTAPTVADLRAQVRTKLPDYMVPAAFVTLDEMPLTPNGKLDVRRLPAPEGERPELGADYVAADTPVEEQLSRIWRETLGLERVGVHDNFFELGGDSILAIQVISKANQAGLRLSARHLFQYQTISELATVVGTASAVHAEQGVVSGPVPLTPIQRWFFEQELPDPQHYNQAVLLEARGPLNAVHLQRAAAGLVRHHDALRLRFSRDERGWRQVNAATDDADIFRRVDLSGLPAAERREALEAEAARTQAQLDPTAGPMMRLVLFDMGEQAARLLIAIHHLAVDGVSWRILLEDLFAGYRQLELGRDPQLSPKTTSFRHWAERLERYARSEALSAELDHWHGTTRATSAPLPLDHVSGANDEASAETVRVELGAEETSALLQDVPTAYRTRINDVLLAALVRSLGRWSGSADLRIDLEGHGREELFDDVDLSRTVGWFTTMFPVHLRLDSGVEAGEALKSVKEQLRAVPRNGIGYGLLRYLRGLDELKTTSEISFNYLGQFDQALPAAAPLRLGQESTGPLHAPTGPRPHLLDVNGAVEGGRLKLAWTFSRNRHRRETIERVAGEFVTELRTLIEHCLSEEAGGCTTSDFPLASLDQPALDRLVGTDRLVEDLYPLSPLQSGLLFHSLYDPDSGMYVEQLSCVLSRIDADKFHAAWKRAVDRHTILRTRFAWEGLEEPLQVVQRRVVLPWEEQDWRELEPAEQDRRFEAFLRADRLNRFELDCAPIMRLSLFRVKDDTWRFVWSHHHLLLDGWSLAALLKEVMLVYEGLASDVELPLEPVRPYRDYIGCLMQQDLDQAETFWRRNLEGFSAPTPVTQVGSGHRSIGEARAFTDQQILLTPETSAALEQLARRHQLTLNTVVQGAWALLLSRYTGHEDVVYGTTVSGRSLPLQGVESMLGVFINTLPVRTQVDEDEPVLGWLRKLQEQQVQLRQFEYTPLVRVQGWSELPRGIPLFESLLIFENYPIDRSLQAGSGLGVGDVRLRGRTHYPVTAIAAPGPEMLLRIAYDRRRFDDASIARMLDHFRTLLEGMAADPEGRLSEIPLATPAERHELLVEWNATAKEYTSGDRVHTMFEDQVERTPESVAAVCEDRSLTYRELNERANRLAHYLRTLGVGPETYVGICIERSPEMLVGLIAVLKAGGAYVPLDPAHPEDRLNFMLREAGARWVVTRSELAGRLAGTGARCVCLDADDRDIAGQPADNPSTQDHLAGPAYVIYTSGSMGRPKGVVVEHRQIANYVRGIIDELEIPADASYAMAQPLSVDSSQTSIFPPLVGGGTVHLITEDRALSPEGLADYFESRNVDVLKIAPSHLAAMHHTERAAAIFPRLRLIIGGEASRRDWVEGLQSLAPGCRIYNHYGPTEATVGMLTYEVKEHWSPGGASTAPVGRPMPNARAYLLDRHLRPVPIGVAGELHIGGACVARGYLNRPDLTAVALIPDPFGAPGSRMYRTGDLCRRLSDGAIEFLGRIDHQVKIRGFRVEPGEVESLLITHPGVRECAVVAREDTSGNLRLVAYVVAAAGADPANDELRAFLSGRLPDHMVPTAYVPLEAVPRTSHGKRDLKALPAPEGSRPVMAETYVAPRTPKERALAEIWSEVLGVERVGVYDNFFELGGHSLLATQLLSRVRDAFRVELPLRQLFDASTVAAMAEAIETAERRPEAPPIKPLPRDGHLAPSLAQERLWFVDQLAPGGSAYNMPAAVRLQGRLDLKALQRAFDTMVERHETLRTTFASVDGRPVQVIAPKLQIEIRQVQVEGSDRAARETEIKRLALEEGRRPFDLARGPLLRVGLLKAAAEHHVLLVTMHHIISDGWSMAVFVREFAALYEAYVHGKSSALPDLPVQYADYAQWQRDWLTGAVLERQVGYWKKQLAGMQLLELPTDRPRPAVQSNRGATRAFAFPAHLSEQVRALSGQEGATPFMTILAAFQIMLHYNSGQTDIVVGTDVANRNHSSTEGLIGFFVNQLVMRGDLSGNPTFRELLARVRETTLGGYANQDLPFDKLVRTLNPERDLSRSPLFDVKLVLQNAPVPEASLAGLQFSLIDIEFEMTKFDLLVNMRDSSRGFQGQLAYGTDMFDAARIVRMLDQFESVLRNVVASPDARLAVLVDKLAQVERKERVTRQRTRKQANVRKLKNLRRSTRQAPAPRRGERP